MYSKLKLIAPLTVLILILCVMDTDQTLFSRKKATTTPGSIDNVALETGSVPQKEHWWQIRSKPTAAPLAASNQVTVKGPLMHKKLDSIFESHFNSGVKWVPCLCPMRKDEYQQHQQIQQQYQQQQQYKQQQQYQQQQTQEQQQQQQQQQPQKQQQLLGTVVA